MSPPKQKRRLCGTALRSAEQLAGYVTSFVLQARRRLTRYCVACGARLPIGNFGGYDGKSALSGRLSCYRCADCPCQLLVRLEWR